MILDAHLRLFYLTLLADALDESAVDVVDESERPPPNVGAGEDRMTTVEDRSSATVKPDYSKTILVMDDEPQVLAHLGRALETLGHRALPARDGAEAVSVYRDAKSEGVIVDLVLLYLTAPGGLGRKEAIQELLSLDPDLEEIVSSGYSNDPILANPREYGFRRVLTKPYRLEELRRAVSELAADAE